jgi:hypothetical protein
MNLNLSEFVVYEKKNVYVQHANLHSAPQLLRLQVYTLQTLPAVFCPPPVAQYGMYLTATLL